MNFETNYYRKCPHEFQCEKCEMNNKDSCIRTKILCSNEKAELRRCELNNKKRNSKGIESFKRNTKSGVIYSELVVLINYDKNTDTIGKLLEEPYITKYDNDYNELYYNKYQVYKYKKRVEKFRCSLTSQEQRDENLIIIKYISDPYTPSFSKEILDMYYTTIKFYYTPYKARLRNIHDKKWEELTFNNWDLIYDKIFNNTNEYKGGNSTKFLARLADETSNTFTRNQLTYITTYSSEDCFSFSDIKAILDLLSNDGISITKQDFFTIIEKIITLSKKDW